MTSGRSMEHLLDEDVTARKIWRNMRCHREDSKVNFVTARGDEENGVRPDRGRSLPGKRARAEDRGRHLALRAQILRLWWLGSISKRAGTLTANLRVRMQTDCAWQLVTDPELATARPSASEREARQLMADWRNAWPQRLMKGGRLGKPPSVRSHRSCLRSR